VRTPLALVRACMPLYAAVCRRLPEPYSSSIMAANATVPSRRLQGKVIIVTASTDGIGAPAPRPPAHP
jgi:hypothetical protein